MRPFRQVWASLIPIVPLRLELGGWVATPSMIGPWHDAYLFSGLCVPVNESTTALGRLPEHKAALVELLYYAILAPFRLDERAALIMRPEPGVAAGCLDEVRMVLRDPAVVNRGQFGCGRDGLDGPELAVAAAEQVAGLQVLDRSPALALDPERMLRRRLENPRRATLDPCLGQLGLVPLAWARCHS